MKFLHTSLLIFCLTCSGYTPAQTTVCSGDSVVLVLTGYKQGDVFWRQSSDKITWLNASGTLSNDSLAFAARNTYYYRAKVNDGTCSPFYSDTVLVIVNPTPPIAKPATGINQYGFTANWSSVPGATDYFLDVATNSAFTSFVPTYKNVDVSNTDTTYSVGGLTCHTPYYYRVRDTSDVCPKLSANSNTITVTTDSCPHPASCGTITDSRDGKIYKTIAIGPQCWMAQNLNVGTAILGEVQQNQSDTITGIKKYCYGYGAASNPTDSSKCATYGGLYLWDEMMNYAASASGDTKVQGICPTGWHIPTDDEWTTLVTYLGGDATAGKKLKDTTGWTFYSDATKGTNSSGFSALPGGAHFIGGLFSSVGNYAFFWSATESAAAGAWIRCLGFDRAQVQQFSDYDKAYFGLSVRCVKD